MLDSKLGLKSRNHSALVYLPLYIAVNQLDRPLRRGIDAAPATPPSLRQFKRRREVHSSQTFTGSFKRSVKGICRVGRILRKLVGSSMSRFEATEASKGRQQSKYLAGEINQTRNTREAEANEAVDRAQARPLSGPWVSWITLMPSSTSERKFTYRVPLKGGP